MCSYVEQKKKKKSSRLGGLPWLLGGALRLLLMLLLLLLLLLLSLPMYPRLAPSYRASLLPTPCGDKGHHPRSTPPLDFQIQICLSIRLVLLAMFLLLQCCKNLSFAFPRHTSYTAHSMQLLLQSLTSLPLVQRALLCLLFVLPVCHRHQACARSSNA